MMKVKTYFKIEYEPLETSIHEAFITPKGTDGQRCAFEVINSFEKIIRNGVQRVELLTGLSNLQAYSRTSHETIEYEEKNQSANNEVTSTFHRQLLHSVSPSWYHSQTMILTAEEVETFLKIYLIAHESFGRRDGIALAFRSMLECVTHCSLQVLVEPIGYTTIPVPEHLRSLLGKKYSTLGSDFTLGKHFVARSTELHIYVGPIQLRDLETLQQVSWADGVGPGAKASLLSVLLVPYNICSIIHFMLVTAGFRIGTSRLKIDRLGLVANRRTS